MYMKVSLQGKIITLAVSPTRRVPLKILDARLLYIRTAQDLVSKDKMIWCGEVGDVEVDYSISSNASLLLLLLPPRTSLIPSQSSTSTSLSSSDDHYHNCRHPSQGRNGYTGSPQVSSLSSSPDRVRMNANLMPFARGDVSKPPANIQYFDTTGPIDKVPVLQVQHQVSNRSDIPLVESEKDTESPKEILQENLELSVRPLVASSPTCLQSPL
ncbi:hypothetical protein Tco_0374699 [Tanacetum coccineum]